MGVSPVPVQMWEGVSPALVQMWAGRPHPHRSRPRPLRPRACSVLHPVPCECGPAGKRGGRGGPRWLGAPGAASATDDGVRRRDASRTRSRTSSRTHARTRSPTRAPTTDALAPGRAHVCASRECAHAQRHAATAARPEGSRRGSRLRAPRCVYSLGAQPTPKVRRGRRRRHAAEGHGNAPRQVPVQLVR
jgi:hypothetical protein